MKTFNHDYKKMSSCNFGLEQCIALIRYITPQQAFQGVKSSGLYTEKYGMLLLVNLSIFVIPHPTK